MALLLILLQAVSVLIHHVQALRCECNTGDSIPCIDGSCEVDDEFHTVLCEVTAEVYRNNTIRALHYYCVDNSFLLGCPNHPTRSQFFDTYYACCDDEDYCNRCLIPTNVTKELNHTIQRQLEHCNFSSSTPSSLSSVASAVMATAPSESHTSATATPSIAVSSPPHSNISEALVSTMATLAVVVALCLVIAMIVVVYVWCKRNERHKTESLGSLPRLEEDVFEGTNGTSGSGSGQRLLEQRTIARQIKKIEIVGKGRYGEVWLGEWGGESVAIKIFSSQDEDSWAREGEVYSTYMLHHDNIAKFIACDKRPINLGFELWMVMEYHHHGSLLDYLLIHSLTPYEAERFVYSIASGLHYLHVDIQTGSQIKPGIAHRDMKSKNILVKNNHSCCISDFGLAVRHVGSTGHVDISSINPKQGTKRYMAPEILDGSIHHTKFESYKMVDMYCYGLIIWEIARRTSNRAEEYQLPYYQNVAHDPSIEDMRKVVCIDNVRPTIASWWMEDEFLTLLSSLMQECWRANPWTRLSALRVKKNIIRKGLDNGVKNGFTNHTFA